MIIKESESEKGREGIVLNHSVGQHYVVEYVLIKSTHTHSGEGGKMRLRKNVRGGGGEKRNSFYFLGREMERERERVLKITERERGGS